MPWEGVKVSTEEPAGFDPAKPFADPVTYFKHREAKVAQEYVKVAEAKVRGFLAPGWPVLEPLGCLRSSARSQMAH